MGLKEGAKALTKTYKGDYTDKTRGIGERISNVARKAKKGYEKEKRVDVRGGGKGPYRTPEEAKAHKAKYVKRKTTLSPEEQKRQEKLISRETVLTPMPKYDPKGKHKATQGGKVFMEEEKNWKKDVERSKERAKAKKRAEYKKGDIKSAEASYKAGEK